MKKKQYLKLKKKVTSIAVRWCAKDIRPFDIVNDIGFMEMAEYLFSVGANHANVDISTIIPSNRTVSRNVNITFKSILDGILPEIIEAFDSSK